MFDRIARRYDLMNRLMSLGMDAGWRRVAAQTAFGASATQVLDVATGTGDLAIDLARLGIPLVVGLDFSGAMLHAARAKVEVAAPGRIRLVRGDALSLPFGNGTFDAVTVGFGLRNMPDYAAAIEEMGRVLKPGGRLVILEMTPVQTPVLRDVFSLYFDRLVPALGGLVSGDRDAYGYLPRSVGAFPPVESLADLMRAAGLRNVRYRAFALGTVAMHVGIRS